jgi:hypothetical protein
MTCAFGTGGATANHQNIGFGEYRNLSCRFHDRFVRPGATHLSSTAEQLDAMRGADTAAVIAAARRIAKNFALPSFALVRPWIFAFCHAPAQPSSEGMKRCCA